MTRLKKKIVLVLSLFSGLGAFSQTTTSSPYSREGVGLLSGPQVPQNQAMGGVTAGLRRPGSYNNINLANPASYSAIDLTTFDIGMSNEFSYLAQDSKTGKNYTASLSHLLFAVPVTRHSALSFGLLPYSRMGYRSKRAGVVDTNDVNYIESRDGGLSKAYLGYGIQLGKHFSVGANASYIFGKLEENYDVEYAAVGFLNSRTQYSNSIGGLAYDYGVQYFGNVSRKVKVTLGYNGSAASHLKSNIRQLQTLYTTDALGNAGVATDTSFFKEQPEQKLTLPASHTVGFAFERSNKWFFGADVNFTQWEKYRLGPQNPGLQNSLGIAVGGQITPDINSVTNYLKLIDYRLGFKYNKTYLKLNDSDIKETAITVGFGFPLPANRSTFYKINLAAEIGQRGTMDNDLVRDRYINVHLGFTINDKWFQRYKFD